MAAKLKVACAIIINSERKILLAQRSSTMKHPLQWEFPGGKIKMNENSFQAITREIKEELHVEVSTKQLLKINNWNYGNREIELHAIICELLSSDFQLTEHQQIQWFGMKELWKLKDLLAADKEFLQDLEEYLNT